MKTTLWFMKGYSNLYHAINDIKQADEQKQFEILCTHTNPGFVGFESADICEIEPSCSDIEYLKYCEKMILKHNVKVIFAANRQVMLHKNKDRLAALGAVVATVASHKMIPTINNKAKLYKLLSGNDIVKIPEYAVFNTSSEFDTVYKKMKKNHSTLCMKPTHGVYGIGFYVLKDKSNDLTTFLNQEQKVSINKFKTIIQNRKFKQMILMQFLEGAERSVDCVAFNGQFIGGTIRKKSSGLVPQLIEDNPDLIEQVKFMVKKLKLNGMFNIQFRDSGGVSYLLEINPRLSGRSYYSTIAGFNIPYVASVLFSGLKKPEDIKYSISTGIYISAINCPVISTQYALKTGQTNCRIESK